MRIFSQTPDFEAWLRAFGAGASLTADPAEATHVLVYAEDLIPKDPVPEDLIPDGLEPIAMNRGTLREVFDSALRLGRLVGHFGQAMQVCGEGERRIAAVRQRYGLPLKGNPPDVPTVRALLEPGKTAGGWVDSVIEIAGGHPGEPADLVLCAGFESFDAMPARTVPAFWLTQAGPHVYEVIETLAGWLHELRP
ncbi:MAG: hypothetical protein AAF752_02935 [Bacteroidota bacterium]